MPKVIWITGLSGAGKTTLAHKIQKEMDCALLDGDVLRTGLCSGLGFSAGDRNENIRRVSEVAKLFYENGKNVIVACISPLKSQRDRAKSLIPEFDFIEIYVATSLAVCEERDAKGLYAKARAGELKNFTGIDSKYEPPLAPDIIVEGSNCGTPVSFEKSYWLYQILYDIHGVVYDGEQCIKFRWGDPQAILPIEDKKKIICKCGHDPCHPMEHAGWHPDDDGHG